MNIQHTSFSRPGSRRMVFVLIVSGLCTVLAGCGAKRLSTVASEFSDAPLCCGSLAELPVEPVTKGDTLSFNLGDGSPVYRFDTGKSYFRLFALPEKTYPYRVTVDSYLVGGYLKSSYLFAPLLITLDKDRKPVRTSGRDTFSIERAGFVEAMREAEGLKQKLTGGLTFTLEHQDERYLLILTTDALLKEKTAVPLGGDSAVLTLGTADMKTTVEEVQVPHAAAGRLRVSISSPGAETAPAPTVSSTATAPAASRSLPGSSERAATGGAAPVGERSPMVSAQKSPSVVDRPEVVVARLSNGMILCSLELGKTETGRARQLFEHAGAFLGSERKNSAGFLVGPANLKPKRLYAPAATPHLLYFDESDRLVLFVDRAPVDVPASGMDFVQRYPGAWETGRTLSSYELQTLLTPCVALIATFRTANDALDAVAYGYSCSTR